MYKVKEVQQVRTVAKPKTAELKEQPKQPKWQNKDIKDKLKEVRQKTLAASHMRILLVGVAREENPDNPQGIPQREARLYMFAPTTAGDITEAVTYDSIMWDKVDYRLEVYDFREDAVNRFCANKKLIPESKPGQVSALATAYDFDANGQHVDGNGQMDLLSLSGTFGKDEDLLLCDRLDEEAKRRGEAYFSLQSEMYSYGYDHLGDGNAKDEPVFTLKLRGPNMKTFKCYAIPQNNKLCHSRPEHKTYFHASEPINFKSIIDAIKNKKERK